MNMVEVELPAELVEAASLAGLDISAVTEAAPRDELAVRRVDDWLDDVARLRPTRVSSRAARAAVRPARDEFELG